MEKEIAVPAIPARFHRASPARRPHPPPPSSPSCAVVAVIALALTSSIFLTSRSPVSCSRLLVLAPPTHRLPELLRRPDVPADPPSPAHASSSSRRRRAGSRSCCAAPTFSQLHDLLSISLRWWWTSKRIRTRRSGYGTVKDLTPEPSTRRRGGRRRSLPRRPEHPPTATTSTTLAAPNGSTAAVPPTLPAEGRGQGSSAHVLEAHAFIADLHRPFATPTPTPTSSRGQDHRFQIDQRK